MYKFFETLNIESDTLQYILFTLVVFAVAAVVAKILRIALTRFVNTASGTLNVDPTKFNFLKNAVSFLVIITAIIIVFYKIPGLRDYGVTLFAGAGVIGIIVGFASQSAFSNIISGIFLVIFKPFRVGDNVRIGDLQGNVQDITLRHTVINNFENRRIVIPNSIISDQTIINSSMTEDKVCVFVEMSISYDSNVDLAMSIMQELAMAHPNFIDNRSQEDKEKGEPAVRVRIIGFGDSSVNLRAWVWSPSSGEGFAMKCDLFKSIKERWEAAGIEIPFPYRTLVYKNEQQKQ